MFLEFCCRTWPGLRITGVEDRGSTVRIHAETVTKGAPCPECGGLLRWVHSRYRRLLSDTAIGGREVLIGLRVRRFVCPAIECPRRIFAERLDSLTNRYGRRTHGASEVLESVGLALGGRAGARLAARFGLGLDRMSLLRLVRNRALSQAVHKGILVADNSLGQAGLNPQTYACRNSRRSARGSSGRERWTRCRRRNWRHCSISWRPPWAGTTETVCFEKPCVAWVASE